MPRNCPKCDALMEHQEGETDTGIIDCWICTNEECGEVVEVEPDDFED
jgi:hypothetical protein